MKPNLWVIILFSLSMGIVIMALPYIITLPNHFNKERLLIWRKFLIIISACYLPVIAVFYIVGIASHGHIGEEILLPWWQGCYFAYIALTIFVKKHTNLQLGWFKFILFSTVGYLITTVLLLYLSELFGDLLCGIFFGGAVNYL
ncbi:MAG: hypothetical protein HY796_03615 [Elusimicrobia bacterium]|nr:hypothetical protein [Elusimicrobiota bacterium]